MNLHSLNVLIGSMAILVLLSGSAARSAEQIRVGYGSLSTSYAPIWVAGEAQLFQKNGITAEVLYLESALVRTALIAGDIVMGGMSGTTMAAPRLQGADPIIIASFLNSLQYRLVVRPEIKTPAQLKGKRIGVAGFGLGAHRGAQIMVAKLGLNPDNDVVMLQIGGDPTRLSALLSGTIDASVFNPPLYKRAVEAGYARIGEYRGNGISRAGFRAGHHRTVRQEEPGFDAASDEIDHRIDLCDQKQPRAHQTRNPQVHALSRRSRHRRSIPDHARCHAAETLSDRGGDKNRSRRVGFESPGGENRSTA